MWGNRQMPFLCSLMIKTASRSNDKSLALW